MNRSLADHLDLFLPWKSSHFITSVELIARRQASDAGADKRNLYRCGGIVPSELALTNNTALNE
jgi:hypothetical protein